MAPQVIKNVNGYDAEPVDVFSLGKILFTLIAGTMPFYNSADVIIHGKLEKVDDSYLIINQ